MSVEPPDPRELQRVLHELGVHQAELESQNEELRRAQGEMVAARARYFDLYELAPVGYLTLDAEGRLLQVNLTAATMLGVARAELERKPLHRFILEEDRDVYVRHRRALLETRAPQACELRLQKREGSPLWVQLSSTQTEEPDGAVVLRTAMTDVTERKQLQLWSEQHRTLLELVASNHPVLETLLGLVRGYEAKLPTMKAAVCLRDAREGLGPSLPTRFHQAIAAIASGPEAGSCGTAIFTGKSAVVSDIETDPRWLGARDIARAHRLRACWAKPILGSSGAILGAFAFYFGAPRTATLPELELLDRAAHLAGLVIEREQSKRALLESEAFSLAILDSVAASIAVLDRNGTILATNERWRQFGDSNGAGPRCAGIGTNYLALKNAPAGDEADSEARTAILGIEAVLEGRLPRFDHDYPCHSPSERRWFTMSVTPLGASSERVVVTHTDISQAKRATEEAVELESQLHQASKMQSIGRLAGGVAHDFNNMLGVILGHVEVAMDEARDQPSLREDLRAIQSAAERSAALTQQLLAFSRKQVIEAKVLDLNESVATLLGMLTRLVGEEVRIVWRPGASLWRIKMDGSQVDQLLTNLCVNARDAIAERGTIAITTDNCVWPGGVDSPAGDYVRLTVEDDGAGMSEETLSHIFEPFFTTKELGKGTGLGLATVHGVVRQNHGFIAIESKPGKGTRFSIHLPRHAGVVQHAQQVSDAPRTLATETILVVEDEPAILKIVARLLGANGYSVLEASTPTLALALAERHGTDIDLIITDVMMPDMNGRDLASALTVRFPKLRRLFMSGYTADVIGPRGVRAEGAQFLQKPFTREQLAASVRAALDCDPTDGDHPVGSS